MTGTENVLTPRAVAVALIARAAADVRRLIDEHRAHAGDPDDLFHSRIRVFYEQTIVELRRAARRLETVDMSGDPEPDEDDAGP